MNQYYPGYFLTLNGKSIEYRPNGTSLKACSKATEAGGAFAEERTVNILFEETFFVGDDSFQVFCINRPITGPGDVLRSTYDGLELFSTKRSAKCWVEMLRRSKIDKPAVTLTLNFAMELNHILMQGNNNNFNIIMLDIDFFKKVNDNYGHPMGDEVIKKVSNHMQDKVGSEGVVGRFGGEEFLTILYNNDIKHAALLADQIRSDIESKKIEFEGKQISVTVSMGIACSAETGVYQELLNKADERLYKAKENGRNQVITS